MCPRSRRGASPHEGFGREGRRREANHREAADQRIGLVPRSPIFLGISAMAERFCAAMADMQGRATLPKVAVDSGNHHWLGLPVGGSDGLAPSRQGQNACRAASRPHGPHNARREGLGQRAAQRRGLPLAVLRRAVREGCGSRIATVRRRLLSASSICRRLSGAHSGRGGRSPDRPVPAVDEHRRDAATGQCAAGPDVARGAPAGAARAHVPVRGDHPRVRETARAAARAAGTPWSV